MVSERKKQIVKEVEQQIEKYPVVGILDMYKLPARQLKEIKENLRGKAVIRMVKKKLIKIVLEKSKKEGVKDLEALIRGQPALLFSESNPFELARILEKSKTPAPAKSGDIAPKNILISAGPTSLMAGPAVGELQKVGLPAAVEEGKIIIKKDTVVAKEGDEISKELADALSKLGVEPMEIGLDLIAVWDNGLIYKKDILFVPLEKYEEDVRQASLNAFNLSVNINYFTPDNIIIFLSKASQEADSLAIEAGVLTKDTIKPLLAKANAEAEAVKRNLF